MSRKYHPNIPSSLREKLTEKIHKALRTTKYSEGIVVLERYRKSYTFDDRLLYALGVLYDHRGMQTSGQFFSGRNYETVSASSKKRAQPYFKKAEEIFRFLLRNDPKNVHALFRLGVLAELHGEYREALNLKLKAHRIGTRDKKKQIPLSIGFTYLKMGKEREAEEWFKKDLVVFGTNNPAPNFNILLFYIRIQDYAKALPYALKIERMFKQKQKAVQGLSRGEIASLWKGRIQKVKEEAQKLRQPGSR